MNTIEVIPVGDSNITAIVHEETVWVSVRRVCNALGLDVASQRQKLLSKPWASTSIIDVADTDGRMQAAFMVALKSLPMWLAGIDHNKVDEQVAKRLVVFQMEAHDVLSQHFGLSGREVISTSRPSGGSTTSGRTPTAASPASGSALEMLQMFDALSGALRASIGEVAEVRAELVDHKTLVEQKTTAALEASQRALASANEAAIVADRASRAGAQSRESRRRIDAAVGVITTAIRRFCTDTATPYQKIYSEVRADLGLRRTQDGGSALGKSKLRADQVLRLARTATRMGVPGVDAATVEAILNGDDVAPIARKPTRIAPRADDVDVSDGTAAVVARCEERSES